VVLFIQQSPKGALSKGGVDGERPLKFHSDIEFSITTYCYSQSLLLSDCFKGLPKKQNIILTKPTLS
jgi:hypothetical protein